MRFGSRVLVVAALSLLTAMACIGGENQCLNPQPDLPSCGEKARPPASGGAASAAAGAGSNGSPGGPVPGAGGSDLALDPGVPVTPTPNEGAAGNSADLEGGAAGDSAAGAAGSNAAGEGAGEGGAGGTTGRGVIR